MTRLQLQWASGALLRDLGSYSIFCRICFQWPFIWFMLLFYSFLACVVHLSLPASHFVLENALSNDVVPPGDQEAGQIKGCTPSGWAIPMTCPLKVCHTTIVLLCILLRALPAPSCNLVAGWGAILSQALVQLSVALI
jgi:hypothetical protein